MRCEGCLLPWRKVFVMSSWETLGGNRETGGVIHISFGTANIKNKQERTHSLRFNIITLSFKTSFALFNVHYTPYTIKFTLYNIHIAPYTLHFIFFSLYTIHYTFYTIHYTL